MSAIVCRSMFANADRPSGKEGLFSKEEDEGHHIIHENKEDTVTNGDKFTLFLKCVVNCLKSRKEIKLLWDEGWSFVRNKKAQRRAKKLKKKNRPYKWYEDDDEKFFAQFKVDSEDEEDWD